VTMNWDILRDNPILTKHVRTRLRPRPLAMWISVVLVLCLSIVWAGQAWGQIANGAALTFLLGLQLIVLAFIGASQVGGAVGGARETGIIDFHRVSPQPPSWLALGYFLGAPIREYILFAVTVPFAIALAVLGEYGLEKWIQLTIPLVFSAWLLHACSLLSALVSKKPKGVGKGAGAGILVFSLLFGSWIGMGLWSAVRRLEGPTATIQFFGLALHWLLFLLLYEACALGFLFIAAARKMRSERMHAYSKPLALACMATVTTLTLGAAWNFQGQKEVVLVVLYFLVVAGIVLATTITPDQTEYVRAVRRVLRVGRHRPSPWEDPGANRLALCGLCAMVLIGATLSWELIAGRTQGDPSVYSQTIAIGVFVVAYFGLALQYFLFRFAKSGSAMMALFLFLVWLMPLLLGSISFGVGTNKELYTGVLCISPLTGIAMSSGLIEGTEARVYKLVALGPAIFFTFVFNYLLVATQRKIDLTVRTSVRAPAPPGPFDDLETKAPEDDRLDELSVA
jgi:hypothetical protein